MSHPAVSMPKQSDFLKIAQSPLSYWLRDNLLTVLQRKPLSTAARVLEGLHTENSNRFVRFCWEAVDNERWKGYVKGGGYTKWYGRNYYYVDWEYGGARLKNVGAIIPSSQMYFCTGLTYSAIASGSLGLRLLEDSIFTNAGPAVFGEPYIASILNGRVCSYLLRSTNSKLSFDKGYVERVPLPLEPNLQRATETFHLCISLKRVLIDIDPIERSFSGVATSLASLETVAALLHTLEGINEREVFAAYGVADEDKAAVLEETGTPAGFFPLVVGYDALPELTTDDQQPAIDIEIPSEVLAQLAKHERLAPTVSELAWIKARLRRLYEQGPRTKPTEQDETDGEQGAADDEPVSGAHIPIPTETFLEALAVEMRLHPISIFWLLEELRREGVRCRPEELRLLEDRLSVLVLRLLGYQWPNESKGEQGSAVLHPSSLILPNEDGIIQLSAVGNQPKLVAQVRMWLRAEAGEIGAQRTEALLEELSSMSLEVWLQRRFFERHVKQFKYRPIVWQLASTPPIIRGKRSKTRAQPAFECLIAYHACGGDLLVRLRTQYVEPLLRAERQRLEDARNDKQETIAAQAQTLIDELEVFSRRLQNVAESGFATPELAAILADEPLDRWSGDGYIGIPTHADFLRHEQAWHVDRNDGVRVNIAPLQLAGLLPTDVIAKAADVRKALADARKALVDRARWRADERRWVRQGKLPRCGWMGSDVEESPAWTERANERDDEQRKLAEKRNALTAISKE